MLDGKANHQPRDRPAHVTVRTYPEVREALEGVALRTGATESEIAHRILAAWAGVLPPGAEVPRPEPEPTP